MGAGKAVKHTLYEYRRQLFVCAVPLIALPLPLLFPTQAAMCGYILIIMAAYWCTDILPLAITGLIPVFAFPLTGIMTTKEVCYNYMNDTMLMVTASIMVALALESSNLHRRIALSILKLVGGKPRWLLFGFMFPTWFLSMWVSNTAATAMMLPITEAVMGHLETIARDSNTDEKDVENQHSTTWLTDNSMKKNTTVISIIGGNDDKLMVQSEVGKFAPSSSSSSYAFPASSVDIISDKTEDTPVSAPTSPKSSDSDLSEEQARKLRRLHETFKAYTLGVTYAANTGGTATLMGSPPNMIMKGYADDLWQQHGYTSSPVNFASFLVIGLPVATINLFLVYLWLLFFYFGYREICGGCLSKQDTREIEAEEQTKRLIRNEWKSLGKFRYEEGVAGVAFIAMVLLWFFRSPGFMPGWADLPIFKPGYITDTVPPVLVLFGLFLVPRYFPSCGSQARGDVLLTWKQCEKGHPWDLVFLMGGGYALSQACEVTGLSEWIGEHLTAMSVLPLGVMLGLVCLIVALLTEVTSNTAICALMMPIVAAMAESMGLNPLFLMFPVAISTSYAFMLPVATPPNAIAFSYGRLRIIDMVKAGALLNVLCVLSLTLATMTWGMEFFDLDTVPWSSVNDTTTVAAFLSQ